MMSEESVNESGGELDRFCGYIPNSQPDESTIYSQLDSFVHSELPGGDSASGLPPIYLEPRHPFSEPAPPLGSESPCSFLPQDPVFGLDVSERMVFQNLQPWNPLFELESTSLAEENGAEFFVNPEDYEEEFSGIPSIYTDGQSGPIYQELSNVSFPHYSGARLSHVDEVFLENKVRINAHEEVDVYGYEECTTQCDVLEYDQMESSMESSSDEETLHRKYEEAGGDLEEYGQGEMDDKEYEGIHDDEMDDSLESSSFEESSASHDEELIVIDSDTDGSVESENVKPLPESHEKYCEYPVGKPNTVIVTEKDYRSLEYDEFLNDIVIDFYLAYLFENTLPVEYQSGIHMFSTMFYKRLLQMPNKKTNIENYEKDSRLTIAEKRHRRVSGWTKNLDLFSKSVLMIPICEDSHWYFLMVVGLTQLSVGHSFIIVLDSLGGPRKKAARNIRKYLACEFHAKKMEGEFGFTDVDIPSIRPDKPQQPNFTDCGVYLLHYAEKIFANISQFLSPELPCLKDWFEHEEVARKRLEIASLIRSLAHEQAPNQDFQFPDVPFTEENQKPQAEEARLEELQQVDDLMDRLDSIPDPGEKGTGSKFEVLSLSKVGVLKNEADVVKYSKENYSAPPTSTSRECPVSNKTKESDRITYSDYFKSYSKGYKIPRIKKPDSINANSRIMLKESVQKCLESLSPKRKAKQAANTMTSKRYSDVSNLTTISGDSRPGRDKMNCTTGREPVSFNLFEDLSPYNPQIKKQDVVGKFMTGESETDQRFGLSSIRFSNLSETSSERAFDIMASQEKDSLDDIFA